MNENLAHAVDQRDKYQLSFLIDLMRLNLSFLISYLNNILIQIQKQVDKEHRSYVMLTKHYKERNFDNKPELSEQRKMNLN